MDYASPPDYTTNFVNWADVAPFEPSKKELETSRFAKKIKTINPGAPDFFEVQKGLAAPTTFQNALLRRDISQAHTNIVGESNTPLDVVTSVASDVNEIDRIANQRVKLLAVRYASSKESTELVARLEILNRRLLDRSPRISAQQVKSLEDAAAQAVASYSSRENRMRRLGIEA